MKVWRKKLLFFIVVLNLVLIGCSEHEEWSYEDSDNWGALNTEYAACGNGSEQSPINIKSSHIKEYKNLTGKQIYYEPTTFTFVNNGHTVQANASTEGNRIIVGGNEYKLTQFHFHTPSEHQLNDQNYDLEMHFVHKGKSGKLAVLGIMIEKGRKNMALTTLWERLPTEETESDVSEKFLIDLQALLPQNKVSFHYEGSLTTPPCTEEVKWIIFEQPIEMSKDQIQAFQQIFEDNARPVQPLNERGIIKN